MDIDEYRAGYEAGKEASALFAPIEALDYTLASEDWQRGYDDGVAGNPFDPGDEAEEESEESEDSDDG